MHAYKHNYALLRHVYAYMYIRICKHVYMQYIIYMHIYIYTVTNMTVARQRFGKHILEVTQSIVGPSFVRQLFRKHGLKGGIVEPELTSIAEQLFSNHVPVATDRMTTNCSGWWSLFCSPEDTSMKGRTRENAQQRGQSSLIGKSSLYIQFSRKEFFVRHSSQWKKIHS
jgi:hypothetical protein